ncbi:MAG: ABC transporter, partial [Candidatus Hermodarchaeota archaeon]
FSSTMSSNKPLIQLIRYSKSYRVTIVLATLFSILNKWFDLAPPFLIAAAVDIAVRSEGSIFGFFGITDLTSQFLTLGVLTFIIWSFESLFEYRYIGGI